MVLVLCYDVVNNARRTRLHKRLKTYLEPVQKSVFEGELDAKRYSQLTAMVMKLIDPEVDSVRIYSLCKGCVGLVELMGTSVSVEGADDIIV